MTPSSIDDCMMLADTIYLVLVGVMGNEALADAEQPSYEAVRLQFSQRLPPVTPEKVVDDELLIDIAKFLWPKLSEEEMRIWLVADRESLEAQGFVEGTDEAALQDLMQKRDQGLATVADLSQLEEWKRSYPFVHDIRGP